MGKIQEHCVTTNKSQMCGFIHELCIRPTEAESGVVVFRGLQERGRGELLFKGVQFQFCKLKKI